MNISCTICSDLVNQAESIFVTKCGHIFHHHCLSQWIARSKSCPQCRNKVTEKCMFRLYPTISSENNGGTETNASLQTKLDDAQLEIRQNKAELKAAEDNLKKRDETCKKLETTIKQLEKKLCEKTSAALALTEQISYLKLANKIVTKLREENETMKKKLDTLQGLQKVLNSVSDEVELMLQGYPDVKTIALFATALKRALCESESKKNELRDRLYAAKQQIAIEENKYADLQAKMIHLEDLLANSQRKLLVQVKKSMKERQVPDDEPHQPSSAPAAKRKKDDDKHSTPSTSGIAGSPKPGIFADSSPNISINTMVKKIENADSPYLQLRQGNMALTALNRAPLNIPAEKIKPTDYAILNKTRSGENLSIFGGKTSVSIPNSDINKQTDKSYDGLGGHSKIDVFPKSKPVLKNCIPKLTAKHKLRRPTASGSQDISKLFEKIVEK